MNNWVIFFHFEMKGIKFALKLSQMCGIWSTLNIYGKIFTWSIITLHKLVHWFPTSKIYTMLFLNLDGLGRYNDIILTYVCYNFRHSKVHTHIQAWIFLECENLYGWNFNMMSHWWCPLRKTSKHTWSKLFIFQWLPWLKIQKLLEWLNGHD